MGITFSSQELAGAVSNGVPTVSYAYATSDSNFFAADATYSFDGPSFAGPLGEVTPFLVQPDPAAPTITCSPFEAYSTDPSDPPQTLKCPIAGTALATGLYTISFEQYTSTAVTDSAGNTLSYTISSGDNSNTLTDYGGDITFSIVAPTSTVFVTPAAASVTVTSGIDEISPTATDTVPAAYQTITVYSTTIISTSISYSTLTGVSSIFTVTASCSAKTSSSSSKSTSKSSSSTSSSKSSSKSSSHSSSKTSSIATCTKNSCLAGMIAGGPVATIFCDIYTAFPLFPPAVPACGANCLNIPAQLSSACKCLPTAQPWIKEKRGAIIYGYGPPDYTYDATTTQPTVTVTAAAASTDYLGPVPSTTVYDPDVISSVGTSTVTDPEPYTLTTTVFSSTIDARTVSTTTVSPVSC